MLLPLLMQLGMLSRDTHDGGHSALRHHIDAENRKKKHANEAAREALVKKFFPEPLAVEKQALQVPVSVPAVVIEAPVILERMVFDDDEDEAFFMLNF